MQTIKLYMGAAALAILASTGVQAADLEGSFKDTGAPALAYSANRSGFYITGFVGYAWGDRDIDQTITREKGFYKLKPEPVATDYENTEEFEDALADHKEQIAQILGSFPGSSYGDGLLKLPLIGDALSLTDNDDIGSFVYGAEVSYLFHDGGRYGMELAVGGTFYGDADTTVTHTGALGKYTADNLLGAGPNGIAGDPSRSPQTGYASVEREFDIDLLARGLYFVNPNFALTAGAGVSFARAEVCGGNTSLRGSRPSFLEGTPSTKFCDDDTSIGPVVEVGFRYWMSDRISLVGRLDGKWHDFNGDVSAEKFVETQGPDFYRETNHSVDVEDVLWTAKVGASIKLD